MTLDHFNSVKKNTEDYMNYMLGMSRYLGKPLEKFCGHEIHETIVIEEDEPQDTLHIKLKRILLLSFNSDVKVTGDTRPSGRYDYFKSASFTVARPELRTSIHPDQVQGEMKEFVRKQLGLGKWDTIRCRVIDLFKQGIIEWDDVVKAHGGDCEL